MPGQDYLDSIVNVRLTDAEKSQLREDADLAGVSMSEFVRSRYLGKRVLAKADVVAVKELRRYAGLLKQIHLSSAGAYKAETAAQLAKISQLIDKIAEK